MSYHGLARIEGSRCVGFNRSASDQPILIVNDIQALGPARCAMPPGHWDRLRTQASGVKRRM
jgi:hypothetical protein